MVDLLEAVIIALPGVLLGWAALKRADAMIIRARARALAAGDVERPPKLMK